MTNIKASANIQVTGTRPVPDYPDQILGVVNGRNFVVYCRKNFVTNGTYVNDMEIDHLPNDPLDWNERDEADEELGEEIADWLLANGYVTEDLADAYASEYKD